MSDKPLMQLPTGDYIDPHTVVAVRPWPANGDTEARVNVHLVFVERGMEQIATCYCESGEEEGLARDLADRINSARSTAQPTAATC